MRATLGALANFNEDEKMILTRWDLRERREGGGQGCRHVVGDCMVTVSRSYDRRLWKDATVQACSWGHVSLSYGVVQRQEHELCACAFLARHTVYQCVMWSSKYWGRSIQQSAAVDRAASLTQGSGLPHVLTNHCRQFRKEEERAKARGDYSPPGLLNIEQFRHAFKKFGVRVTEDQAHAMFIKHGHDSQVRSQT
jgi:hypothetical protein